MDLAGLLSWWQRKAVGRIGRSRNPPPTFVRRGLVVNGGLRFANPPYVLEYGVAAGVPAAGSRTARPNLRLAAILANLFTLTLTQLPAHAQTPTVELLATLSPAEIEEWQTYRQARAAYEPGAAAYWQQIETLRAQRRAKRKAGQLPVAADYVREMPPVYSGPQLSPALAKKIWAASPKDPETDIPVVADYLEAARTVYGFVPRQVPEPEFKRAYAIEALAHGLTKDNVVRVYAFETGGKGTHDMQAGIDPITRTGRGISTALGYAQLLAANSCNELVKHGPGFVQRLEEMARRRAQSPERTRELAHKAAVVRAMLREVLRVPNIWREHREFAKTPKGLGIHALNLDADVGPWLQVLKLKGLREEATKAGVFSLGSAEMELMNLSGPANGLEMMLPVAKGVPTANFFERGGYERNSVVRGRTAAQLLQEIDARMQQFMQKPGAVEFAAIFDRLRASAGQRSAAQ